MIYDIAIIGRGPAGISAALYAARGNRNCVIIAKDGGALEKAGAIENYYGLPTPLSGPELAEIGRRQALALRVEMIDAEVTGLDWAEHGFNLQCGAKELQARCVIMASGAPLRRPKIDGLSELENRGVSYCAVCDGFFHRGKTVAVLGEGEYALHEAQVLLPIAEKLYLLGNGAEPPQLQHDKVERISDAVVQLLGEERLQAVRLADGREIELSGLFVASGVAGAADLARKAGAMLDADGRLVLDADGMTSEPGLFAAGDCCGGMRQVSLAVADGARASMAALRYLREK